MSSKQSETPTSFFCRHKEKMYRIQGEDGHSDEEDSAKRRKADITVKVIPRDFVYVV